MADIRPRGDNRAQNHKAKRKQGHSSDGAAKPEDLTVRNENNCKVLEDCVDWDREKFESFGSGINHANEEK